MTVGLSLPECVNCGLGPAVRETWDSGNFKSESLKQLTLWTGLLWNLKAQSTQMTNHISSSAIKTCRVFDLHFHPDTGDEKLTIKWSVSLVQTLTERTGSAWGNSDNGALCNLKWNEPLAKHYMILNTYVLSLGAKCDYQISSFVVFFHVATIRTLDTRTCRMWLPVKRLGV